MRKVIRLAVACILLTQFFPSSFLLAEGNPVPGRWEKVIQTEPGSRLKVIAKDGMVQEFGFLGIDEKFLICADRNKQSIRIEKDAIDKVILDRTGGNLKKGALVGALVGTGFAGIFLSQISSTEAVFVVLPLGIAIGGAVGMGLFAAKEPDSELIYISKGAALPGAQRF